MPMRARAQSAAQQLNLTEAEAGEIALEAYIYAYPLVLMEITRRVTTNVPRPDASGKAPMNQFGHKRSFPDASFTDVVRANADTLYSRLWFDVSREPLIVECPDSQGRYYLLQCMDMWSDVFASPGTRTTGNSAQRFAITGPRWMGPPLRGVSEIRSPTDQGWVIGRTQTNGKSDYDNVHAFQKGLVTIPFSQYGKDYKPEKAQIDIERDMGAPVEQVAKMEAGTFFSLFVKLARSNPPHANDYPQLARLHRIGIEPGKVFDIGAIASVAQAALEAAPPLAMKRIETSLMKSARIVNGWEVITSPVGTYGTDYLRRAAIAYFGLGANVPEDAIYPTIRYGADGRPLDSAKNHVLHFDAGWTPPARAFWSLTLYNERQVFAANPMDRYAIGDRDKLVFNPDRSLDIYIQRENPGGEKEPNWLPAPQSGPFSLTLRIYWPKPAAVDGTWEPPPLTVTG